MTLIAENNAISQSEALRDRRKPTKNLGVQIKVEQEKSMLMTNIPKIKLKFVSDFR